MKLIKECINANRAVVMAVAFRRLSLSYIIKNAINGNQ
jgi:hypothetical protein